MSLNLLLYLYLKDQRVPHRKHTTPDLIMFGFEVKWSYGEVLGHKSVMYVSNSESTVCAYLLRIYEIVTLRMRSDFL